MGRPLTTRDIARFGIGEPDEYGRFPRYEYPRWWRDQLRGQAPAPDGQEGTRDLDLRRIWRTAFTHWEDVTAPELHAHFGLDDEDPAFWDRPWRHVMFRVHRLLAVPSSPLLALIDP